MLRNSNFIKIRVFVPLSHAEIVRDALAKAGAGVQGNYDYCSASTKTVGRFRAQSGAKPVIGDVGKITEVTEVIIETLCHQGSVAAAIKAVREAHPYEEPTIDILPRLEVE